MAQNNVGGVGLKITLFASITFPLGITITELSKETDPFVVNNVPLTKSGVGINGDKYVWQTAEQILTELNIIPNTESDKNLKILSNANRKSKNKVAVIDDITITVEYPNGETVTFLDGNITEGKIANGVATDGKYPDGHYTFEFGNVI